MKRILLAALTVIFLVSPVATNAQTEDFVNDVAIVYHTMECVRVPWEDYKRLDNGKNYLIVVVFHQGTSPPTPPSKLVFSRDDAIYFRNTPRGLVFGRINLNSEQVVSSIERQFFGNDFKFSSSASIPPVLRREATENSTVVYTFPENDPNYETRLAQAKELDLDTACSN